MRKLLQAVHPLLIAAALLTPVAAQAQIGGIIRRTQGTLDRAIGRAIDNAVKCAVNDRACADKAKAEGKPVVITDGKGEPIRDQNGNTVSDPDEAAKLQQKVGEGVWRNYDFTPGREVWVATDFTNEPVGRFPASQLEFVNGNMQIVELNGEKVLEFAASSIFRVPLRADLPEDFTLEFYIRIGAPNLSTNVFFSPMETSVSRYPSHYLSIYHSPGIFRNGTSVSSMQVRRVSEEFVPIKMQADGSYVIVYAGADRVANVPNAEIRRTGAIEFRVTANERLRAYLKDIVVAVGVDKMYDALMKSGEWSTRGILFESDSDVLRPESTPTLEDIRSSLASHADLKLIIEGHTDSTGTAEHNLDLSRRRAKSVVTYLTSNGIAVDRLKDEGKGETQPMADNGTTAGRAENRRVVVRLDKSQSGGVR
jgi:outer membrane protein OmpA-like peptidoglycan-associated protein